jgi:DNA polymerase-3 subunit delta'
MSAADDPHPRETNALFGHAGAERALLDAYRSGRLPHAWLIGGPAGIGKATLVYRMARFVLAHPDPAVPAVQSATSLALDPSHPTVRRIARQAHPDLLVLERVINSETGKLFTVIRVDDVRRTIPFFGSTAGEGGWRVCIVDTADELNDSSANALLKLLEEPPPRALFLILSHVPGRLLPTIRSRCRRLDLRPLDLADVTRAAATALGESTDDGKIKAAAAAADGSVGRAITLLGGKALVIREQVTQLLAALPRTDGRALHALSDALGGADDTAFAAFADTVRDWLSGRLDTELRDKAKLGQVAQAWEKVNIAVNDAEEYNLDRRPLVFSVFDLLAQTAR